MIFCNVCTGQNSLPSAADGSCSKEGKIPIDFSKFQVAIQTLQLST